MTCQHCGRAPALQLQFGMLGTLWLMHHYERIQGRYCRDCALAECRRACSVTLMLGWWSFAGFMVIVVLIMNYHELHKIMASAPPRHQPASYAIDAQGKVMPIPKAAYGRPLFPGAPLWRRVSTYTLPIVLGIAVTGWLVYILYSS